MEISNKNTNLIFTSRINSSKALKEVKSFAEETGKTFELNSALDKLKYIKNLKFDITHMYSKSHKVCKTEFKYTDMGLKQKYVSIANNIKNPAEATLNLILQICDKNSNIYKNIFGA